MDENFDGSFKIYMEPEYNQTGGGSRREGDSMERDVENVKEDYINLDNLYNRLQESNEEIKIAQNATTMRALRARTLMDLDSIFKLAKQINKKYDAIVRANAAQRKAAGSGPGSSDDQFRASLIAQLVETLQSIMRKFQGLRIQMETEYRQLIEAKYLAITREKATAEAIDNLLASEVPPESPLNLAMQELGRGPVMEAVAEIQERRDTMKEVRRNLMALHQIFLGIATPVTAAPIEGQNRGVGLPSPVEKLPPPTAAALSVAKGGTGGLNDYERETRKQSYIAIAIAFILIVGLVTVVLIVESNLDGNAALYS